ncbi:MAG: pyridoxamine 5'-phosphate oxidase [Leptospiraceae bacterium]|nr:pyridoxamine 5'-phosphate oxidase [Leptospiraceae bacterium]MDW8307577.1 pyridoxamine 5'-phosphate oxidase [Leptospiraceae bacterium]
MEQGRLASLRREYGLDELSESEVAADPIAQFQSWFHEALARGCQDPNAMVLSTVSAEGRVHSRVVLLKNFDYGGFVFYTNYESPKARDMEKHTQVALLFFWPELERQVRIEGIAEKVSALESNEYFETRPLEAKWSAWASAQSEVIPSRQYLEKKFMEIKEKFGEKVPRPDFWGGYRVRPDYFEFWQGRPNRLHDRIAYKLCQGAWQIQRLSP